VVAAPGKGLTGLATVVDVAAARGTAVTAAVVEAGSTVVVTAAVVVAAGAVVVAAGAVVVAAGAVVVAGGAVVVAGGAVVVAGGAVVATGAFVATVVVATGREGLLLVVGLLVVVVDALVVGARVVVGAATVVVAGAVVGTAVVVASTAVVAAAVVGAGDVEVVVVAEGAAVVGGVVVAGAVKPGPGSSISKALEVLPASPAGSRACTMTEVGVLGANRNPARVTAWAWPLERLTVALSCWPASPCPPPTEATTRIPFSASWPTSCTTTVTETEDAGESTWTLPAMLKAGGSVEMASMASLCRGERETAATSRWANPPKALTW
jgi:hypothetical protein